MTIKLCKRCVLDTTASDIWFNKEGECKYCLIHDELEKSHPLDDKHSYILNNLISEIKNSNKNKKYNCIVGVSGGRDSTYTLLIAKKNQHENVVKLLDKGILAERIYEKLEADDWTEEDTA